MSAKAKTLSAPKGFKKIIAPQVGALGTFEFRDASDDDREVGVRTGRKDVISKSLNGIA
jgi:hypothetical protein